MSMLRPAAVVGVATVASRLLGFARDVMIAGLLGAGPAADAFLAALRLPNALRRVLGEGGLNAGFVPLYADRRAHGGAPAAAAFAASATGGFAVLLAALLALAELAAGTLMLMLAPGFSSEPATHALAVGYLRLMLPFVGFISLASLLGALLNAANRFALAAVAPALVNALLIGALAVIPHLAAGEETAGRLMAIALTLAGALQLAAVAIGVVRGGLLQPGRLRPRPADLARLLAVGAPALAASATAQLVLVVATALASAEPAAVAWFYYADRLFQLPLSFAGVAVGTVLLSELAGRADRTASAPGRDPLNGPLEASLALALPAGIALAALARPIIAVLFERGAFGADDTRGTAEALAGLALGLPGGVAAKVLLQPFFVRREAGGPLASGAAAIVATAAAGLLLRERFEVGGIALAAAFGLWVQAAGLALLLLRRGLWRPDMALARRTGKLLAAGLVMGVGVRLAATAFADAFAHESTLVRAGSLALLCVGGAIAYGLIALVLGAVSREDLASLRRDGAG